MIANGKKSIKHEKKHLPLLIARPLTQAKYFKFPFSVCCLDSQFS